MSRHNASQASGVSFFGSKNADVGVTTRTDFDEDGRVIVVKKGEFRSPNGDRFVGEMQDGRRHGHGTLYYANGDMYMGASSASDYSTAVDS